MNEQLSKQYDPSSIEPGIYQRWLEARGFAAVPDERAERYVIMMPLPNVTGALHMGHAMDNVMQDLLTRWHRMKGANALWMAGTDHAGIATQSVVETRLRELEGKTRNDIGRDALVARIWAWKEEYQQRIVRQQQAMGCSCDWDRQRFTMDAVCARAVRWTFFRMFRDGLIFKGNRLINWDCQLETAVADDEIVHETVDGHFWHLRYPVIDPEPGEPEHVVVATTRPETMLGDTAVACHPDPAAALERSIERARERLASAPAKEKSEAGAELERLQARRASHLPSLEQFATMARTGRKIRLPLLDREIPLILDQWAKPELGSGCVKSTPGHDPNDHDVWTRHSSEIGLINILNIDGTLNESAGPYASLDRFEARKRVVADLDAAGLLEAVEDRKIEIGLSDRSRSIIEPYVSLQWFVRMGDIEGGVVCGRGTDKEFTTPGLAQAAIDAARPDWRSATGRNVSFHPDSDRYASTYVNWLAEKRDWCISRQLWWGHQIPVWGRAGDAGEIVPLARAAAEHVAEHTDTTHGWVLDEFGQSHALDAVESLGGRVELLVCLRDDNADRAQAATLEELGLTRDPDVLDTWFSSGLWPHSTLGWPDPETAAVDAGQAPLGATNGSNCLDYYYPGSCLVTGRDIITLWVARMVLMGLYNLGDVPFTDVFLHANILDGKGVRMSKSKGNGIDPVDIIERYGADAMRYVLCEMQTGTQDIRLPVQAVSPFSGNPIDMGKASRGRTKGVFICPESKQEFDVIGTVPDMPRARLFSDRFEVGRNFANKLWNAARFAFMNLEGSQFTPRDTAELAIEDRWILSRLTATVEKVTTELENYNPSAAISAAREFFWSELCDWYLELIKPRMGDDAQRPVAQQVLGVALDQVLRLLHPFIPYITEELWRGLGGLAGERGLDAALTPSELLVTASWPEPRDRWRDRELEERFGFVMDTIGGIRELRSRYTVPQSDKLEVRIRADGERAGTLRASDDAIRDLAGIETLTIAADAERTQDSATAVVGGIEVFVVGVVDLEKERKRLTKERDRLTGGITGIDRKLANEGFLANAGAEVVERERERLERLRAELRGIEAALTALD